jgi:bleomycin hydrolase
MNRNIFFLLPVYVLLGVIAEAQVFVQDNRGNQVFSYDFTHIDAPKNIQDYELYWHSIPVSQGRSGTCWAYSAVSMLESEVYRLYGKRVKLSEMFVVYYEYVERAEHFVKARGETFIGQGSENNAIIRIMRNYGLMPFSEYSGLMDGKAFNNHSDLFKEYYEYLTMVKNTGMWDKDVVISNVKAILNKHLGEPPQSFKADGNIYTASSYLTDYLKLNPSAYFSFMSTIEYNFNEKHELVEDDNWWFGKDYYNIELIDFMNLFHKAIANGYTISLCGDVTESGYDKHSELAIIPSYDIPAEYIDANARQFRLANQTTIDDHCIHVVGYIEHNGEFWYLIKDSNSGAFDGANKGYRFYHQDYIKLKMIHFMIHVDPAREILDSIIK